MFQLAQLEDGNFRLDVVLEYGDGNRDELHWTIKRIQSDAPEKSGGIKIEREFA